jgi:hypothetical protein
MCRNILFRQKGLFVVLVLVLAGMLGIPGVGALIQTDIVYSMDDTYVNSSDAATNYDGSSLIMNESSVETWFRFNLSDPTGYYVVGSVLWLYVNSFTGNEQYAIHKADTSAYTETDLTWNSKPAYGGNVDQEQIGATGWFTWDITSAYSPGFDAGNATVGFAIEGSATVVAEDKEDTLSTGNVPYLNLTMMIPETDPLSPDDLYSTYDTSITFQYNTTDAGNIVNCSILFDGVVNKTNTSVVENSTAIFLLSGIFPGDHTWSVRCFDSGRSVYQMDTETRDFTVQAHVEYTNPSSATPLDIGSVLVGGTAPDGTRDVSANNSNNNAAISCASGDCTVITTNWSTVDMSGGQTLSAYFNCSSATPGSYTADFSLTSDQDASADTLTVNCTILAPDLRVNSTNITFSNNAPTEDETVTITAGLYNDGDYDATNAVVRFYEGHYSTGTQIGSDQTVNISSASSTVVQQDWTAKVGEYDIYVVVDPPVDTNGSIEESDETNNYAYSTITVSLWTTFVGNVTGTLALLTETNYTLLLWNVTDTTSSLIYVTDTDSNPSFSSLVAFGRNTTGSYMTDDFIELDNELNSTSYPDSINLSFTSGGNPVAQQTFTVFGNPITNVPVVNSTNSSTFVTGMLWDSSDDSNSNNQFDNTSDEDVVFVTMANQTQPGRYGTYDYEIKVPASLKDFKGPNTQTVTFYAEIK